MAWMIGIDEAGYGPNLGPLAVAATAWWVEESEGGSPRSGSERSQRSSTATSERTTVDLYARLTAIVSPTIQKDRLAIADSKALYKPKGGLHHLERGVLTALATTRETTPTCWQDLIEPPAELPWYSDFDCPLPLDADAEELPRLAVDFSEVCAASGVRLQDVRARLVFPREFNELTERYGTKGAALSHVTIELLRETIDALPHVPSPPTPTYYINCDKHGGRNRYAALLQHHFSEHWIETLEESTAISRYAWSSTEGEFHIAFRARGESQLPTALASMTAKYHRELAMRAFNDYWGKQVPNLKPTAGYPMDARRFKQQIAGKQVKLGIEDADLWRNR